MTDDSDYVIRDVSLVEMLAAMAHMKDEDTFRWFQTSIVNARGEPQATDTLRVTMGQARRDVQMARRP